MKKQSRIELAREIIARLREGLNHQKAAQSQLRNNTAPAGAKLSGQRRAPSPARA